jgi:hypothetical protein
MSNDSENVLAVARSEKQPTGRTVVEGVEEV